MPIAAAPDYLGTKFCTASPGQRFGMYLKLWGVDGKTNKALWTTHDINYRSTGHNQEEREFHDENKTHAIKQASALTRFDKSAMEALTCRQRAIADSISEKNQVTFFARSIAPFTTGLGNEHPLENGFAFLNPYGLPYLPGSGVKGVMRRAAQELASGDWGCSAGWSNTGDYSFKEEGEAALPLSIIDVLFGREPPSGDQRQIRGALTFWDVIPQIKGARLQVDIMTPHQGHYYQPSGSPDDSGQPNPKIESPHDSGQPNPISFLTVPPGSRFTFHVTCNRGRLKRLAPGLVTDDFWKTLIKSSFMHAFEWLGFGAKTAIGYGAMVSDHEAEREARRATMTDEERMLDELWHQLDAARGGPASLLSQGSKLANDAIKVLEAASGWAEGTRLQAADLIEEVFNTIGFSKKKKHERKRQISALRQGTQ